MSNVLIHYIDEGPVGLWREKEDNTLESYYLPTVSKKWKERGTHIVNNKGPNSSYDELFKRLCSHSAYMDHFGTTESEPGVPLESILFKLRRESVSKTTD